MPHFVSIEKDPSGKPTFTGLDHNPTEAWRVHRMAEIIAVRKGLTLNEVGTHCKGRSHKYPLQPGDIVYTELGQVTRGEIAELTLAKIVTTQNGTPVVFGDDYRITLELFVPKDLPDRIMAAIRKERGSLAKDIAGTPCIADPIIDYEGLNLRRN